MLKQLSILLLFATFFSNSLSAQLSPIQLDRPDQTECPFIVPAQYLQLENGLTLENARSGAQVYSHPTTLWKYGLNDRFEFRFITEFVSVKDNDKTTTGLNPVTIGFKTNICQEKGIVPVTSFIGHLTTPNIGTKAFHTTYFAPSFRFLMQHTLHEKVALAYNLGAEWNGETAEPTFIYTLTTGISFTGRLGGYLEVFGFAPQKSASNHSMDFGLTYLVNNDCMLDLSAGFALTDNAPKNYVSFGFSYRFKTTKS